MCGFAALFEPGRMFAPDLLNAIDADLYHRGPDSGRSLSRPGCALVFRRLSILDTRAVADQPMQDDAGRYAMVFNGEIYNFKHLRSDLEAEGCRFKTNGDAEVLLQGFMQWGERLLDRLEGMYAFVIVDFQEGEVTAARDPYGIKPLYLLRHDGLLAFASEMRPFRRLAPAVPDPDALAEHLLFRFAAGRLSNQKDVVRVPGGTLVRFRLDGSGYRERRFCDVLDGLDDKEPMDRRAAQSRVDEAVRKSIHDHLISDVGYAVQLSGGIDSSLVAAITAETTDRPPSSFSLYLGDNEHDEKDYRDEVRRSVDLDHHEIPIDARSFADAFPRAIAHMEGPSAHLGCIALMLLCDKIRESTKVVLTGEGADELFGGYERYARWRDLQKYRRFARMVPKPLWPMLHRYRAIRIYADHDPAIYSSVYQDYLGLMALFPDLIPGPGARDAAASRFRDFRDRMFAVDQTAYLESLLLRQDKMAMAASVEARVPFTHVPLARVINKIPHALRAPGDVTKPLLKDLAARTFTKPFAYRRKVGLTLPLAEWLSDPQGLGRYLEELTSPNAYLVGYGERSGVRDLVERFRAGDRGQARVLTHLINLELWLKDLAMPPKPVDDTAGSSVAQSA